jgi:selenide, water dikinase
VQEAFDLASQGVIPGGSKRNQSASAALVDASGLDDAQRAVLFDAQTSGGLLIAVPRAKEEELLAALRDRGVAEAAVIGSLVEGEGRIEVLS